VYYNILTEDYISTNIALCLNGAPVRSFIHCGFSINEKRLGGVIVASVCCWLLAGRVLLGDPRPYTSYNGQCHEF